MNFLKVDLDDPNALEGKDGKNFVIRTPSETFVTRLYGYLDYLGNHWSGSWLEPLYGELHGQFYTHKVVISRLSESPMSLKVSEDGIDVTDSCEVYQVS